MRVTKEELVHVGMQLILHAGNARLHIHHCMDCLSECDFTQVDALLKEAQQELKEAHLAQTKIIQQEARGAEYDYCVLFNHAQDTLMSIYSEYHMCQKLSTTMRMLDARIKRLEEGL